jgi:histidyl-tRNA synthetase
MRLFSPHFARPALFRFTLRRTSATSKFTRTAFRAYRPPLRPYCSQPLTGFVDDDMGKEDKSSKNFNLKVPKGTRDCTIDSFAMRPATPRMYR